MAKCTGTTGNLMHTVNAYSSILTAVDTTLKQYKYLPVVRN